MAGLAAAKRPILGRLKVVGGVVCFGEALIDFLHTGQQEQEGLPLNRFTQFPGGAPANVAVAVAGLGGYAKFAGQVGDDAFGRFLLGALQHYGVDTEHTLLHPTAATALAFVFLDPDGERHFLFRRHGTADVILESEQVVDEWFQGCSIAHYCSNTLTDPHIARVTHDVVSRARDNNLTLSFDVNLRHNLWPSGAVDADTVNELVFQSDLVKFSREEFDYLRSGGTDDYLQACFSAGVTTVLITDGAGPVTVATPDSRVSVSPPGTQPVDTTGAGDAFIGAVLFGLSREAEPATGLRDAASLQRLVDFAGRCGALAVSRQGAFPSFPKLEEVRQWLPQR